MKSFILIMLLTAWLGHAKGQSLSLRTLALEGAEMPACFVAVGKDRFEELKWPTKQQSQPITVQAKGELAIYSRDMDPNGTPQFKIIRNVKIPEAVDEILLLGVAGRDDGQADFIAVPDNHRKADFNDWVFINLSSKDVSFRYGRDEEPLKLSAGEFKLQAIKGGSDKGSEVIAEAMIKGEMKKIYSTFWSAQSKQRSLVLFLDKEDAVKVLRIVDHLREDTDSKP